MPDETLYPSLDGSSPGTNPDGTGQDVSETGPLPDLFEASQTISEPGASQILEIETPAARVETNPIPQDRVERESRSRVQERMDRLTGRAHAKERENNILLAQVAALTEGLTAANQRLAQLSSPRPSAPGSSSDPFGAAGQPKDQPGSLDEGRLDSILSQRLAPVLERLESRDRVSQTRAAHEAAFEEAAREFPELRRQDSSFRQKFNELYDGSPLRQLPDAPYQIALQVRGLLADERAASQVVAARKAVASVSVPNQPTDGRADVNGVPIAEYRRYEEAKKAMRDGTATAQQRIHVARVGSFLQARQG